MTEEDWVDQAHPLDMIDFVLRRTSGRKLRLFVAVCCDALCQAQIARLCERVADGLDTASVLQEMRESLEAPFFRYRSRYNPSRIPWANQIQRVVWAATQEEHLAAARDVAEQAFPQLQRDLIVLIHEIFGTPFRSIEVAKSWLHWNDGVVSKLARTIYDDRTFDRMPLLADALEDAGCDNAAILEHCRGPGPHVRGCWVVDLILSKDR